MSKIVLQKPWQSLRGWRAVLRKSYLVPSLKALRMGLYIVSGCILDIKYRGRILLYRDT